MTDALRWPIVGPLLRWRHARTSVQLVLLATAVVVVLHGFLGPDIGSANLATVLTWVHYRGLLVVALLAAGNLFCFGCPMVRVRDWGRLLHLPTWHWPKRLRGKWMAVALFAAVLFTYELFDLWALPRSTAYLVLAYFGGALVIDVLFTGATFCKHLCPIGQFNFVASTLSPLELRIKDEATCGSCQTSDCIKGRHSVEAPRQLVQRGCELGLFLPAKVGNIDCTFCLDCVQACPHDNIAMTARAPGLELADTRRRSGIGRLSERPDIAALAVLFVFGAVLNAFAMVAPVRQVERWLAGAIGSSSEAVVLACVFAFGLGVVPLVALGGAAIMTRLAVGPGAASYGDLVIRYVFGLVPFGFGLWLAHYGFHFLTGALVVVPVVQSAAVDVSGWALLGEPLWQWAGMRPGAVFPIQLGLLLLGAIGSLAVIALISLEDYPDRAKRAAAPWAILVALLAAASVWVLSQPMDMRGLGIGG